MQNYKKFLSLLLLLLTKLFWSQVSIRISHKQAVCTLQKLKVCSQQNIPMKQKIHVFIIHKIFHSMEHFVEYTHLIFEECLGVQEWIGWAVGEADHHIIIPLVIISLLIRIRILHDSRSHNF